MPVGGFSLCLKQIFVYKTNTSCYNQLVSFLFHLLGLDDPGGSWYLFWSGFGADIPMLCAIGTLYYRHNCHIRRCWRIGRHHDGQTITCRKHKANQ